MPVTSTAMIWPLAKPLRRTTWRENASRPVPVGPPYSFSSFLTNSAAPFRSLSTSRQPASDPVPISKNPAGSVYAIP